MGVIGEYKDASKAIQRVEVNLSRGLKPEWTDERGFGGQRLSLYLCR